MSRAVASFLHPRMYGGLPDRYPSTQANPIGDPSGPTRTRTVTRETAPMHPNAGARIMHPKLNTRPWSTSYAVQRPAMSKRKAGKVRKG